MSEVIPKTNMEKLRHFSTEGKLSEWESNFANSVITQLEKEGRPFREAVGLYC